MNYLSFSRINGYRNKQSGDTSITGASRLSRNRLICNMKSLHTNQNISPATFIAMKMHLTLKKVLNKINF